MSASPPDEALRTYAARKARRDGAEKVPYEVRGYTGRGFLFVTHGMYWRDVSKVAVDFEKAYVSFDYYHFDRRPAQGHVDLDDKTRQRMIALCNSLWEEARDNLEQPGDPVAHGIQKLTQLVLVDGNEHRVFGFSVKPLPATQKLYDEVWRLIGEKVR